jgi:hypothetical protein
LQSLDLPDDLRAEPCDLQVQLPDQHQIIWLSQLVSDLDQLQLPELDHRDDPLNIVSTLLNFPDPQQEF